MNEILNFFPKNIFNTLYEKIGENFNELEEIRLRVNKPIILKFLNKETIVPYNINNEEILNILQRICDNSIYSYQNQICNRIHYSKRWS